MCHPTQNASRYRLFASVLVCIHLASAANASSPEYQGYIEATSRADVYSRAEGIVDEVFVQQGDYVTKGDPLLRVRQDFQLLAVQTAKAELAKAEALLAQARGSVERIAKLSTSGTTSNVAAIEAQTQYVLAEAERDLAKTALDRAETELADTTVRAPISGFIEDPRIGVGSLVQFSSSDPPLFQIVNLDPVNVVFEVPYVPSLTETNLERATYDSVGKPNRFDILDTHGQVLARGISASASAIWVDTQSGTIRTWAELENAGGLLRPGMMVKAVPRNNERTLVTGPVSDELQGGKPAED